MTNFRIFAAALLLLSVERCAMAQSCPDAFSQCAARAFRGDAAAQYQVGNSMIFGKGTIKNEREGFAWVRASAYGGNLAAYLPLCIAYSKGQVVPEDFVEAYAWCHLSAKLTNNQTAVHNLQFLSGRLGKEQIAEALLRVHAVGISATRVPAQE